MALARELPAGASGGGGGGATGVAAGGLSLFYVPVQRDSAGRPQVRHSNGFNSPPCSGGWRWVGPVGGQRPASSRAVRWASFTEVLASVHILIADIRHAGQTFHNRPCFPPLPPGL